MLSVDHRLEQLVRQVSYPQGMAQPAVRAGMGQTPGKTWTDVGLSRNAEEKVRELPQLPEST